MRQNIRCRIGDEVCARCSKAIIQNSTACGTGTMAHTSILGARGQHSETNVWVRDMNTIWYRATIIMRGESGDTLIAETMHDIMNTQIGQP
jgi:hypothetical protein